MATCSVTRNTTLSDSASKTECHNLIDTATATITNIVNADVGASAAIVDTKLATISSGNKVNTSALTTTSQAAGDFLYHTGTAWARLPVGTAGQKLQVSPLVDYMEYSSDATAQAAYVTNASETLDQSYSETNQDDQLYLRYAVDAQVKLAQTFLAGASGILTSSKFYLKRVGTVTGNIWATLYATSSGVPTGSALATSATIDASTIGTSSFALQTFTFSSPVLISSGTTYAIVIEGDYTYGTNLNVILVGMDASSPSYTNGAEFRWDGSSWGSAITTQDICFYVYLRSLQSYSESTIKTQGSYALKGIAAITGSLNKTLTRNIYGSNFLTGGTASASDVTYGAAANAVDGNTATRWCSDLVGSFWWWKYDLGAGITKIARKLRVYDIDIAGKDFTLQGSNNDSDWANITTGQFPQSVNNWLEYPFANSTAYRYYRVYFSTSWSSPGYASMYEVELMEVSSIDLSGQDWIKFDIRSSRTGSNIKIGIHDSGGTTTETTPNVTQADTFQTVTWDISAVSDANKDAIDSIIVTVVNADAANTFYIDNWYASSPVLRWVTP